jgi:hypothetical protein
MKTCDFCGKETDDYKLIPELDNLVMCLDCLEDEIDLWNEIGVSAPYDCGGGED